jgi:peptidoglycan/LPS O-acetylase OafA/YrhL
MLQGIADRENHLDYIDGLRGIAILMVLMNHWYRFLNHPGEHWLSLTIQKWTIAGNAGVILFFLVSSFTLFLSSERRAGKERTPVLNFYLRRFFRIWPVWLLAIAIYFALSRGAWGWTQRGLDCFLMLCPAFAKHPHLFTGTWSLLAEETFYLFFPLAFSSVRSLKRSAVFFLLLYYIRFLWIAWGPGLGEKYFWHWELLPPAHWYAFGLGIFLYFLSQYKMVWSVLENREWGNILGAVSLFVTYRFLIYNQWGYTDDISAFTLVILFMAAVSPQSIFGRLVRARWLRMFGICCYSIYLFHPLVLILLTAPRNWFFAKLGLAHQIMEIQVFSTFFIFAFICLGIGILSFKYLEKPSVLLGKQIIRILEARLLTRCFS